MSEQNRQIVRRFTEAFAANDAATLAAVVADEAVDHNPAPGRSQAARLSSTPSRRSPPGSQTWS